MCYCKQLRYPRTNLKHLVALGVTSDMAVKHAISRKKDWRMYGTLVLCFAMTNEWQLVEHSESKAWCFEDNSDTRLLFAELYCIDGAKD